MPGRRSSTSRSTNAMNTQEQIEIIEAVAIAVGGELVEGYSGRGMFGAKCLGIICESAQAVIEEAAARGLRSSSQDNMGKDFIVYWPHLRRPAPSA